MEKKGLSVDAEKLEEILGFPVVTTVTVKGKGIK
jgi:Fe2+ transport system protein B